MPPKGSRSLTLPDEESTVTTSMVTQLLEQQKEFFREMIQQQQDNFKCFVQIITDSVNKRMDDVIRDLQGVKTSLEFTQAVVDEMSKVHRLAAPKIEHLDNAIKKIEGDLATIPLLDCMEKLDYIENQTRRNNILVDGIPDEKGENWNESERKVRAVLQRNMGLDIKNIEFERAHRIGMFKEGRKPRPIIVKLLRFKDKQTIQACANKLKGSNIYINEDFTDAVQKKRRDLLPELKAARERGDIATLKFDKLVIKPKGSS